MNKNPPSAFDEAVALYQQGRFQEALAAAKRGLAVQPEDAGLLNMAGAVAHGLGFPQTAQRYFRKAIAAWPGLADAYNNLGLLLHECGRQDEAEAVLRRALERKPRYAEACYNLGLVMHALGRLDETEAAFRRTLELAPGHPRARCNLGILLLSLGRFAEGWSAYEARWDLATTRIARTFPRWNGESLAGKALLLVPEQGFGDQIQFCRYVPLLKQRGATRVDVLCDHALTALFETLDGADAVLTRADDLLPASYDYWTTPLSIPRCLGTTLDTIPVALPYLHALPERVAFWAPRLPHGALRVGLVWRGRQTHPNDAHRSLPGLRTLAPLWSVPGVTFVSLQKGASEDEAAAPPDGQPLVHLGSAIEDFADTAAIVSQLDLVICVDTAVAHLAGALGRPCWVLLPHIDTDWRWLRERTESPWYPGVMRLFRQTAPGDWAAVVGEVAHCLRDYAMRR